MKWNRPFAAIAILFVAGLVLQFLPRESVEEKLLSEGAAPVPATLPSTAPEEQAEKQTTLPVASPEIRITPQEMWKVTSPRLDLPSYIGSATSNSAPTLGESESTLLLPDEAHPEQLVEPSPVSWTFLPEFKEEDWSLSQPELSYTLPHKLTSQSLAFSPQGARLRPRSPYCMPGHTSQNFVVYSAHDGLPLHPGVW